MQLFPVTALLELVAIDLLDSILTIKRGNQFLLVLADQFSTLVKTIPLTNISEGKIAKSFVDNWVLVYIPPKWL